MLQLLVLLQNTQVYIPISVGAGQVETLNIPEDGVLYAERNGTGIIDGIGVVSNTSGLSNYVIYR
jgi:hypothetical protein